MPLPGDRLGGQDGKRYELRQVLGQGGMGAVFRAFDHELQRMVALKFLLPNEGGMEFLSLLREEAKAIATLDHENIVRIHDVSEWNVRLDVDEPSPSSIPFLVMEYLEGESLKTILRRERLGLRRTLEIALDVAAGLAHAHERHLVHRDIKPGNVLILPQGRAKLLDFGLARRTTLSRPAGAFDAAGTPAYMAPEQWKGEPPDVRSDIWAAGILLFEMLTGELPFPMEGADELRARVTSSEPVRSVRERRPELPEEIDRLVAEALAKEPAARIPDGAELLRRLRELKKDLALEPESTQTDAPHWRPVTMVACLLSLTEGPGPLIDPEEFGEVEAAFHQACSRLVRQYGGAISTCVGAEVLACMGYPVAREDDSEQAVRLALRLTEELPRELGSLCPRGLSVRIGVHSDQVIIGDMTPALHGTTPAMQGDAPHVASWLASQALPGTVLLSDRTFGLVAGSFQLEHLGHGTFSELQRRVEIGLFRVVAARRNVCRFDRALVAGKLTPLVGRGHELRRLAMLCEEALSGRGGFIVIRGEAGIGKSRLIQELHDQQNLESCSWIRCQCWLQFKSSAFYPLIDWLQRFVPLTPGQPPAEKQQRLQTRLEESGLPLEQVPPIASLLSLPIPESSPYARLAPERQREMSVGALVALLERLAARQHVMLVLEDVHWADPSTLQFLDFLLDHLGGNKAVVLLTARPELEHRWTGRPLFHELELEHLKPERTEVLIHEIAGGRALAPDTVRQLADRTDGIPLFVEEMTRMVLEQGGAEGAFTEASPPSIPATLHELLLARLDQLMPRQRFLVQLGAILGREFSEELLRAVSFLDEEALQQELEHIEKARLLMRHGLPPAVTYVFKHALIQDAAYHSLLRSTRQRYHRRVVQVLMEQFPEQAESHPELLAQHYAGAGNSDQAVEQFRRAGQRAAEKSAFVEASHHFNKALKQLLRLPPSRERDRREIVLRVELALVFISLKGYGASEVGESYSRAFDLCEQLGGDVPLAVLWGMDSVALVRADREATERSFAVLRRLAESSDDPMVLIQAHQGCTSHFYFKGEYDEALRHSSQALALIARYGAGKLMREQYGPDRRHLYEVVLYVYLFHAASHFFRGSTRQARRFAKEALALAEATQQPYLLAMALTITAPLVCEVGLLELARQQASLLQKISIENKLLYSQANGICVEGASLVRLGDVRGGIEKLREGLSILRAGGAVLNYSYYVGVLAQAYLVGGRIEEGLAAVREGLVLSENGPASRNVPQLKLLQGDLLLQRGDVEGARSCFEQVLALTCRNGARVFRLQAARKLESLGLKADHAGTSFAAELV